LAKECVIWLTGLPGSGKTTIAKLLEKYLSQIGKEVEVLDGDEVRKNLSPELGFTKHDREIHARRVVYLSKMLSAHSVAVIVALISPYRSFREYARESIGSGFIEIWVRASTETCHKRDPKGLYKKADKGEIKNLTGQQDPYEPPIHPEVVVNTESQAAEESAKSILDYLASHGYMQRMPEKISKGT
jgi:adenylylsulfate kinase